MDQTYPEVHELVHELPHTGATNARISAARAHCGPGCRRRVRQRANYGSEGSSPLAVAVARRLVTDVCESLRARARPALVYSGQGRVNGSVIEAESSMCSGATVASANDSSDLPIQCDEHDAAIF